MDLPESKGVQSNATTIRKSAEEVKLEKVFFEAARKKLLLKPRLQTPIQGILGQYGIELLFKRLDGCAKCNKNVVVVW